MKLSALNSLFLRLSLAVAVSLPSVVFGATYLVNSTVDSSTSTNSLRGAIINANANPGSEIILGSGTYALTITGAEENSAATGDLDITADLTISGSDAGNPGATVITGIVLDQNGNTNSQLDDRIFHIRGLNGAIVTLKDLTISNGMVDGENGGGIYNSSTATLILDNVVVRENGTTNLGQLRGQALGGGIYNEGTLITQNGSIITGNTANVDQQEQAAIYGGGGLYNNGDATIKKTTFRRNIAVNSYVPESSNEVVDHFSSGGAILNRGTLFIEDSLIGGATETITESYKTSAESVANISEAGGGISNVGGFLTINRSTISYNRTSDASNLTSDFSVNGRSGGGIFGQNAGENRGSLLITASTISNNYSDRIAGGILNSGSPVTVTHTTINNNSALNRGGGFVNLGSQSAEISNSTIAYNTAISATSETSGGGLFTSSRINITSVTVAGNYADTGAQIYVEDSSAESQTAEPQITLTTSIIDHATNLTNTSSAEFNCVGSAFIVSRGYNVDSGDSCNQAEATFDFINTDPLLATTLEVNQGNEGTNPPTKTIALPYDSPARNVRNGTSCPARDQRYFRRDDGSCDAGAFEYGATEGAQTLADLKVTVRESNDPSFASSQVVYTVSVINIGPDTSEGVTLTFSLPSIGHSYEGHQFIVGAGICNNNSQSVICSLGDIAAFDTVQVSFTFIPTESGDMGVTAVVSSSVTGSDYFPGNDSFTEVTEIQAKTGCGPGCPNFTNSSGGGGGHITPWLIGALAAWFGIVTLRSKSRRTRLN